MNRLTAVRRLFVAALATSVVVVACRATQPSEAPPLAPRPEPTEPGGPTPANPLPSPTFPTGDGGVVPSPTPNPGVSLAPKRGTVVSIASPEVRADGAMTSGANGPNGTNGTNGPSGSGREVVVGGDHGNPSPPADAAPAPPPPPPPPAADAPIGDAINLPPVDDAPFGGDASRPM